MERAKIIPQRYNEFYFRNVLAHPHNTKTDSPLVLEETLFSVGEDGVIYLALRNQTAKERMRIKKQTVVGKAVLTSFVLNSLSVDDKIEATTLPVQFVNKVQDELNLDDSSSQLSSFAQDFKFLSSTKMS